MRKHAKKIKRILSTTDVTMTAIAVILFLILMVTSSGIARNYQRQLDLGRKYYLELKYDKAILAFETAINIDPRSMEAYEELAQIYIDQNDYESAIAVMSYAAEHVEEKDRVSVNRHIEEYQASKKEASEAKTDSVEKVPEEEPESEVKPKEEEKTATEEKNEEEPKEEPATEDEPKEPEEEPVSEEPQNETKRRFGDVAAGSNVEFGTHGGQTITWRVLTVADGRALLVSENAIDSIPYDSVSQIWATSDMRAWLNGEFYENAFSAEDKGYIELTHLVNSNNPQTGVEGGPDTDDRVFLLSIDEVITYFDSDQDRQCKPTEYAIQQGALVNQDPARGPVGGSWWRLRSPGTDTHCTALVNTDGSVDYYGNVIYSFNISVRPALWIRLES